LRKKSGHPVVIVDSPYEFVEILDPRQLELSNSPRVPLPSPQDDPR